MQEIAISKLKNHPKNVRKDYDDIEELKESIKRVGILQNLTVVPDPEEEGMYLVVIGNRRLMAAKAAMLRKVPCTISDMSESEQIATMLSENMQRRDLNAIEQIEGVQMCLDLGCEISDLSKKTGFSEKSIRERKKIADMKLDYSRIPEENMRQITLTDLTKLSEIKDTVARQEVLKSIGTGDFTYQVQSQIKKEKDIVWQQNMVAKLPKDAEELESSLGFNKYESVKYFYQSSLDAILPEFRSDRKYAYYFYSSSMMYLYTIDPDAEVEGIDGDFDTPLTEEEKEERENNRKLKEKRKAMREEEAANMRECRMAFMKDDNNILISLTQPVYWLAYIAACNIYIDVDIYMEAAGISDDDFSIGDENAEDIAGQCYKSSLTAARLIYAALECGSRWPWFPADLAGYYKPDERLATLYRFLEDIGYELSDTERAVLDGTSSLYEGNENDE